MEQQILDEKSFLEKYNFDNYVHITVANPTTTNFTFVMMIQTGMDRALGKPREEQRTFMVPAGGKERFVGSVANLYLDQMSKKMAQEEEKFSDMADFSAKGRYYDDLIVSIDDPFSDAAYVPYDDSAQLAQKAETGTTEVAFAAIREDSVAKAEKERLEQENAELRALLETQTKPAIGVFAAVKTDIKPKAAK